jgi:membrane associated rhomboid family serine protease
MTIAPIAFNVVAFLFQQLDPDRLLALFAHIGGMLGAVTLLLHWTHTSRRLGME